MLAALVAGLVTPFQISNTSAVSSREPSDALLAAVDKLSGVGVRLARAQAALQIESPIQVDLRYAPALHCTAVVACRGERLGLLVLLRSLLCAQELCLTAALDNYQCAARAR